MDASEKEVLCIVHMYCSKGLVFLLSRKQQSIYFSVKYPILGERSNMRKTLDIRLSYKRNRAASNRKNST
jgi:hypothetical protein